MSQECFIYRRTVAFGDCDAARVLYTPRAVDYAVEAVESWYDQVVGVSWSDLVHRHGLEATFRGMECDYLRPMIAGQVIRVRVRVIDLDAGMLTLRAFAERAPGEAVFQVSFKTCLTDIAKRVAVAIPKQYRERIQAYRSSCRDADGADGAIAKGRKAPGIGPYPIASLKGAGMPFTRVRRINYGECGVSGSMYLPRIIECAVERVGEWYQECLGISWLDQCISRKGVPFVNIRCDCLSPLLAGQTVTIVVRIPRLGNSSIGYQVVGYDSEGAPCFVAELSACYISDESGPYAVLPFPDDMRGRILAYQSSCTTGLDEP